MSRLSIGRLARLASVSIDTIRFYEKAGLLSPVRRPSGFREYSPLDLKQLRFIRRGRSLGLSLEDIGELLALKNGREHAVSLLQEKLKLVDRKIDELWRWRSSLLDCLQEHESGEARPAALLNHFIDETDDLQAQCAKRASTAGTAERLL